MPQAHGGRDQFAVSGSKRLPAEGTPMKRSLMTIRERDRGSVGAMIELEVLAADSWKFLAHGSLSDLFHSPFELKSPLPEVVG